jgi:enoyl-CoA hydratase/carnithine racemase
MVDPVRHNALDLAAFVALTDAADRVRLDSRVRAVVLSGDGPSFSSGLDLASFSADWPQSGERLLRRDDGEVANLAQRAAIDWARLPVPVIAAIHGACFGGGLQIALGADIRVAAADARLSVMEVRLGLVPDMGASSTLARVVRADVAKELTFTGRIVTGDEALGLGLVTRVDENPHAAALELAREIAARSPDAVRAAKVLFEQPWRTPAIAGLALEAQLQGELVGSANQLEALRAAATRETPRFSDSRTFQADQRAT